jgi:peptidoglycan hydrolase FlgJ
MTSGMDFATALSAPARFAATSPAAPSTSARPGDVAGARKSAEDFTAFFFSQSLESMFADVSPDSLFGGGSAEGVFRSLLLQQYGKIAAESPTGRGITDAVQRQILQLQEHGK